jgi:F-type H+-transporting ATPase subunit delta
MKRPASWAGCWAAAFSDVLGDEAGEGLSALKAIAPVITALPGAVMGSAAAVRMEKLILLCAAKAGISGRTTGITAHFLAILIKRNLFTHLESVISEIEKLEDAKKGILNVYAESAFPLEADIQKSMIEGIKQKTGARELRFETRQNPELLGGYRLRIGNEVIDASVRSQLAQMAAALAGRK